MGFQNSKFCVTLLMDDAKGLLFARDTRLHGSVGRYVNAIKN